MKIILTWAEGRVVNKRVSSTLGVHLAQCRRNSWNRTHVYVLPAIAWRLVLDELTANAYGVSGGKTQAPSLYSAIAKIAKTVRKWELHPAFVPDQGVVGLDGTVVPGFIGPDGRSPYPSPDAKFVLLLPRHHFERGRKLTTWEPVSALRSSDDPLHREEFHRVFVSE